MKVFDPIPEKEIKYKKVCGFDIETCDDNKTFLMATFYSTEFQKVCYDIEDVVEFLSHKRMRDYVLFATNLPFDFLGMFYNYSNRWTVSERNGNIYSFTWYQNIKDGYYKSNPIKFYDTVNIHPRSVEELGKIIGIPKMDHPDFFPNKPKNERQWQELTNYCMNDSMVTHDFVQQIIYPFLKKYNVRLSATIGSIAMNTFRTKHLTKTFFQETEDKREIAFKGYYGGRTEVFKRGTFTNVSCYDVNSLYPTAMKYDVPDPNSSKIINKTSIYLINNYEGVSHVTVHVPDMYMPPLPYRHDNKLVFPVGVIDGYWTHLELRNAMKHGCKIIGFHEGLFFSKTVSLFKGFVNHHYGERQILKAAHNGLEVMEKNVMNNLYGKFAFNYKKCSQVIPAERFDIEKHAKEGMRPVPLKDGKFFIVESVSAPPIYSFPIWSAYITARARVLMYDFLCDKRLQEKLIYTDTDSIFLTNHAGEIKESVELGGMKLEDNYPVDKAMFIRPKMYYTHSLKCKGLRVPRDKDKEKQTLAIAALMKSILAGEIIYQQRFTKLRTALRSLDNHKFGELIPNQIIQVQKSFNLEDSKRVWTKRFTPFTSEDSKPIKFIDLMNKKIEKEIKVLAK